VDRADSDERLPGMAILQACGQSEGGWRLAGFETGDTPEGGITEADLSQYEVMGFGGKVFYVDNGYVRGYAIERMV